MATNRRESITEKMERKYGNKKEEEKKSSSTTVQESDQNQSNFAEVKRQRVIDKANSHEAKMDAKYLPSSQVNDIYINTFLDDVKKFTSGSQSIYDSMSYLSAASMYDSRKKTANNLTERSRAISKYLDENKDAFDPEQYDAFKKYLDEFNKESMRSLYEMSKKKNYFSQWETYSEYEDYENQQKDYEEKSRFDITAGEKEIAELEQRRASLVNSRRQPDNSYLTGNTYSGATPYAAGLQVGTDMDKELAELDALISQKKQYLNQARHIQEGITLAGVADRGSDNYDINFNTHSQYKTTIGENPTWGGSGNGDTQYEWINNQNGFRDDYENQMVELTAASGAEIKESYYYEKGYDKMTSSEIAIYNYYYAKEGRAKAQEYLNSIQESLNHRKATAAFEDLEGNTAMELVFGVSAGLDQFESGLMNAFNTKDDYIPQSAVQMASAMVREDLADNGPKLPDWLGGASLGQAGYDLITTSANMAPSILASVGIGLINPLAGQITGNALMGASAAGNAYQEALNNGYDKDQARLYSSLIGGSEAVLGQLLGGVSKLGGTVSGHVVTNMLNGVDNAFLRFIGKLGGSMISEGLEEGLQEILTPMFENFIMHTDEKVNWSEVAYSALLGALTAGIMEGPSTVSGEVGTYKTGKQLQKADISAQRIADLGKTFSSDTVAYQLAGRVDENTGAYTMGRLFNEIGATMTEQNVNEITNALVQKGIPEVIARNKAKLMANIVEGAVGGETLSDGFINAIEDDKILAEAVRTSIIDSNTTWWQRSKGYNDALMALAQERTAPGQENAPAPETVDTENNIGSEAVSEADIAPAKAKSISTIKNGQVTVKMEDGSEVNIQEAGIDPDDAVRIDTIASIDGITSEDANFVLNTLRESTGTTAQMDSLGAKEAYRYGFYGFSEAHLTKHGVFANSLSDVQRKAIYDAGRKARAQKVALKPPVKAVAKPATGKVHFEGDRNSLTERQSASLTAMEKVADALGVQIHVFESKVGANGKRIGANGWYDPKDSSIHIDLHAGANGEGTMLFTAAHELTHHIRKWSPEKFKTLSDFLMQEYGKKGVNVDGLVREQMAKAKRNGRTISYDTAFEEVVADSMESMLADGNVMEKLAKLKQTDKSLWQKVKDFISELAAKIRSVYEGLSPDSVEGRYVAEMKDSIERLQELFTEGLVDASENYQAAEQIGLEIDADTESVSPAVMMSERTWTESDYVQEREKAAEEIAKAIGVSEKKAKAYINSVNSIAKMIAEDRTRLDYFSSPGRSSFVSNVEYGGSFDFSTLCKKRRLLTGTFTAIQKALPNTALTADEILDIRNRMKKANLEVSCGLCYVEGSRANMGQFAKEFLKLYKQYYPDAWQPNMADVNTPDGIEWVRINHPECYEQYEYFWNHYGTLKSGDKNLFASQQKPKLYQLHTEYKGEILEKFKDDGNVEEKNLNGGIRLQSFSDFEIVHLIDTMQIIMDMSRVGLAGQAYTKVPDFAWALGDTGLKINLSLIAKGVDENGKLIFDDVEGMPIADAMKLRDRYSKNVGTILVAFNDAQLLAAMADDRVDYIIPFHRSQWKKSQYAAMGLPAKTKDYTYMQNEKFIKPQYHEYRGRMVKDKATNYMPNEYWDFSKSGKENAVAYLEMCARNNKRPKFYKLLQNNGDGSYSLKADGSTDGYWKLLIDFKMYDNSGKGSPQMAVKPEFNMDEATRMLDDYKGGHSNFPVAQGIVDEFVKEYKDSHNGVLYSDRVTDQDTLDFLNNQLRNGEVTKVYRAMQVQPVDENGNVIKASVVRVVSQSPLMVEAKTFGKNGKIATYPARLFSPMAGVVNGKWSKSIDLNEWEQTTYDLANAYTEVDKKTGKPKIDNDKKNASYGEVAYFYGLVKGGIDDSGKKLTDVPARYNPYIHTSLSALNDQFSSANKRPELVTVECIVPNSELTSSRLAKVGKARTVILTRYDMPVRVLPDSEVAKAVAEYIGDTENIAIKGSTVTPSLSRELMNLGISVLNEEQWSQYDKDFPTKTFGKKKKTVSSPGIRYSDRDFLAEDQLKGNYTVSEISEMFDAWNSDAGTAELAKKVFAKLQEIQDDLSRPSRIPGFSNSPYPISFKSDAYMRKTFYTAPNGVFVERRNDNNYGITYNLDHFRNASDQEKAHVLLHEAIHACTVGAIASAESRIPKYADPMAITPDDSWGERQKAGLELIQVFSQVRVMNGRNNDQYGQKSTHEMVAEMASPEFREMLKKQRLWNRIVDAIKRIFGIEQKTAYDAVSDALERILEMDGVRYSDRDTDSVSNRSLLANAFEGVAQNDIERNKIQEYKGRISLIESEEQKLRDLNEKIKDLSFAKGPKDTKAIRDLQFEARQTANRISTYDKQLLRLEASKPLQDVLTREKKMAYQRAEKKGKEALEAYREKATKTQRELMDRYEKSRKWAKESREKTAMRHKIKDVVNDLNQYLLKGTKDRHVPIGLQKAVAEALNAVNMDTVGAEERIAKLQAEMMKAKTPDEIQAISKKIDHIREMGDNMSGKMKRLKEAYDDFLNSDDPLIANSHDDGLSAHMMTLIVRVGDTPLRDMSLSQLQDVYDVYKIVLATVRNANKSFKDNKNREISTRANQVMAEIDNLGIKRGKRLPFMDWVEKFGWDNLKPVYAMEHIGSKGLIDAFNNVRSGEDVWAKDVTEAREYYLEKFRKYRYDSWDFEKKIGFTSTTGKNFELTLDQIMSLYAYSKRDQAADHLKYGGIVFDPKTEVVEKTKSGIRVKYNVANATAYNISDETLADIISKLTPEQKGFVDEMQAYLSDVMGAKGNEVSLAMYDVKLFREKNYFPLKSAHQYMAKAKEQAQGEVKIKNSGFSKETKPHAKNPIVLSSFMDVWSNHVNEMSMYHAFVLPMEDFYRIYNYTTPSKNENMPTEGVNAYIENAYGSGVTGYIEQMLKDLNGGARTDSRTGFINKMMGKFKKGAVFASLSVVIQQPSAIARAAAIVDTKYFIGPKVDHKRHKALWDEVKKYAPVAIIKEMGYFDTNMGKSTQDFILGKEYSSIKEKMTALVKDSNYRDEVLSKAPALADEIAWCGIWEAVKRETKAKNKGMDTKSEAFLKKAGERFTEVITKTQVYDSVLARSANMRSKDTGMKMATAFMAEPTTSINMIADALLQGKRGNKKYCRAAIGAVIASQIFNSILVSFVYAGRDDDEDKTYWEKYIGNLTGKTLDGLNPLTYIPFIKDMVSIAQGYDVERSDMAVISDLWNAYQNLSNDKVSAYRKVEGFAGSIAQIFGLPVKNIMRDVRGIYQTINSFMNGQQTTKAGIEYAVKSALPKWMGGGDVTNQNQLYEAILSGDKAQTARVKGRYKDQSAVNAAVRKALRENDPRIRAAAEARVKGNLSEYTRIAKQIIGEKHFSQDDVVAAINAEINAMDKDETKTTTYKASGLYKAEDFVTAISNGDSAMANAIRSDIIQTAQKNGKSAEEAEKNFNSTASGDCKELFMEGKLSESKAINALVTYCGVDQEDAEERVSEWAFQKEYGFTWSNRDDAYKNGEISEYELKALLMDVGGKTEDEADLQIQAYDWEAQGYEGVTSAAVREYNEHCADADVPKDIYLYIRKFSNNTDNDVDEQTGKTIYYSAMKKIMAEIDAQDGLSAYQKDAIAKSLGWSDKNIRKYKLW